MIESTNLCLSCGLCCDGTLIGFVRLDTKELSDLSEIKHIEEADGKGFFLQPCDDYCDGCTIYSQRPKQCAKFKCGLLKSVEKKKVDFDSAIEVINTVKQKKEVIEKKVAKLKLELKHKSFYFKTVELKKILQHIKYESDLSKNHQQLMSDLNALELIISEKFDLL